MQCEHSANALILLILTWLGVSPEFYLKIISINFIILFKYVNYVTNIKKQDSFKLYKNDFYKIIAK